ncbi:hypothetical protein [Paracidovorax konjaci]|uniref:Uncharacterized protein n=1 Tax=Paracidovorax konjaci TaxID=32040 RepID=A0A1I1Y7B5_9BURK|nr:hypothetical protein [Paracidovorax konjaci]SFE15487.1 hypothetical protein SAMN04489710_11635 [Paracidovorax konjaci]
MLRDTSLRTARQPAPATRSPSGDTALSRPAPRSRTAPGTPAGLPATPNRPRSSAGGQTSAPRNALPPPPQPGDSQALQAPASSASRSAAGHSQITSSLPSHARSLPADASLQGSPGTATAPPKPPRTTLRTLLARERLQDEARQMYASLPEGGKVMKRLKERAGRQQPTTVSDRWRARLQGKPQPMEGRRKEDFKALVHADVSSLTRTGRVPPLMAVDTIRMAALEGSLASGTLETDRKLLLDTLDQVAVEQLYQRLNLKVTPGTQPLFTDKDVIDKPVQAGSGTFNKVYGMKLRNAGGSEIDGIFKPLNTRETGCVAYVSGIPKNDPQTAMRNIATVAYARKLGLHVVVDTRLAVIDTGRGPLDPDVGLMMERAQGRPAARTPPQVFRRADVCEELTKLQLLDHLTGQGDRHGHNYFIHIGAGGRAKIAGIDNDQCFGKDITDPAGIRPVEADPMTWVLRGTNLPPVVDVRMAGAIDALTPQDIHAMLKDKLNPAEIDAAIQRHQGVKDHIARLEASGRVIDPADWGRADIQQLMTRENSYVGSALAKAQHRQAGQAQARQQQAQAREDAAAPNHETW